MKTYNYLLFDWDGCLAQTLEVWRDSYVSIFAEYDLHPTKKQITTEVFGDWDGPLNIGLPKKDLDQFTKKLQSLPLQ